VLIADDSELMRRCCASTSRIRRFEVVGEAATGTRRSGWFTSWIRTSSRSTSAMPELGGEDALDYIMSEAPRPVVIVSAHTERLADAALRRWSTVRSSSWRSRHTWRRPSGRVPRPAERRAARGHRSRIC
jgi:chemotaxis response regulator CheB